MTILLQDNEKLRRFIARYLLVGLGLFLLMYISQQQIISRPVNSFTAHSVEMLAQVFNFESGVEQRTYVRDRGQDKIYVPTTLLQVGDYTARIILECSAFHVGILLVTFLLAYPATISQKIQGLVFLLPCLIAFNSIRIFILMLLGHFFGQGSAVFNLFHVYIMQVLITALVLVLALFWLRRLEQRKMDDPIWFLLRFIAISMGFTLLWFKLKGTFDIHPGIIERSIFPFLTFASLALSCSGMNFRLKAKEMIMGFGVMAGVVIIAQLSRSAYQHFNSATAELLFVMSNSTLKYILPFGLFFFLVRKQLFFRKNLSGNQIFRCPLCDKTDIRNLEAHAQAKHPAELWQKDKRLLDAIHIIENSQQQDK